MRAVILFAISLFWTLEANSQQLDTLLYSTDRKLVWEDFRGVPTPADSTKGAEIAVSIIMRVSKVNFWTGKAQFKARAVQHRNASWVSAAYQNDYTLAHEQLHFDIAHLHALRLEDEINRLGLISEQKDPIDRIYNKWVSLMMLYQKLYDYQTEGGNNRSMQKEWLVKVAAEISAY